MPAERRFRLLGQVAGPLAAAVAAVALALFGVVVWLDSPWLIGGFAVLLGALLVGAWPRPLPRVVLRRDGVEVRNFVDREAYAWPEVRDFALVRRGPRRPVRIVLRLRDGSARDLDALAQAFFASRRTEARLRALVEEMNDAARALRWA